MDRERLTRIQRRQDDLLTRQQLLAVDMTESALRHAIRKGGPWQRVLPGIYATFNGSLTDAQRLRAAVLYAGPGALITGPWACRMSGLKYGPEQSDFVDVLVGRGVRRDDEAFVRFMRTKRTAEKVGWLASEDLVGSTDIEQADEPLSGDARRGVIPMVHASRAVVDTVTVLRRRVGWRSECAFVDGCPQCRDHEPHDVVALRNVRALLCEVVQGRRSTLDRLADEVNTAPRRDGALARRALEDILAGCRSAPECELRDLVRKSRVLPEPRWNERLPNGPHRIYPDACWPEAMLVVEVDSRSFHGFGDAPEKTEQRRALYAKRGWRVLPVSPARLRSQPNAVLKEIEAAYQVGRA